jgi:hypothetical protein
VKKIALPVKYLRDAKKLLPSLFEDILPEGNYSYTLNRYEDEFLIFAYEDKKLLELLNLKGINVSQVKNIYFAQNEFVNLKYPVKIDENSSLYFKDKILILVPNIWVDESVDLEISSITLSKHSITLKQFENSADEKVMYTLIALLILIISTISVEYYITTQKISKVLSLKEELFKKHSLKPTMFQNKSMLREYVSINKKQMLLRKYIKYALNINLKKSVYISLIDLRANTLIFEFHGVKKGREKSLKKVFDEKNVKYISSFKKNRWHMEIKL